MRLRTNCIIIAVEGTEVTIQIQKKQFIEWGPKYCKGQDLSTNNDYIFNSKYC